MTRTCDPLNDEGVTISPPGVDEGEQARPADGSHSHMFNRTLYVEIGTRSAIILETEEGADRPPRACMRPHS
jgi:hypothetical protein